MRKFLLVVFIGMVLAINILGFASMVYNKYFVEEEVEVIPNTVEVIYVE